MNATYSYSGRLIGTSRGFTDLCRKEGAASSSNVISGLALVLCSFTESQIGKEQQTVATATD